MSNVPFENEVFIGFVFGQTMDPCPKHGYTNHVFLGNPENTSAKLKKVCKLCEDSKKFFDSLYETDEEEDKIENK